MQFEGVIRKGETWNNSKKTQAEAKMLEQVKRYMYGF